jgi:hypothetical protein
MKTLRALTICGFLSISISSTVSGQASPVGVGRPFRESDLRIVKNPITDGIVLSDSQLAAVKALNLKYITEAEHLKASYGGQVNPAVMHTLLARRNEDLRRILTPSQNAQLDANMRKHRPH